MVVVGEEGMDYIARAQPSHPPGRMLHLSLVCSVSQLARPVFLQ